MSLADELLADLEADEDEENEASFDTSGGKHQTGDLSKNSLIGAIPMEQGICIHNVTIIPKVLFSNQKQGPI